MIEDFLCQYAKAQQSENIQEMKSVNLFTSSSSILSYPSLYQHYQHCQQLHQYTNTNPNTTPITTTTMRKRRVEEDDEEVEMNAGESKQEDKHDPYRYIRQRPAHLQSGNNSNNSSRNRNSTRDRNTDTFSSSLSNHSRM